MRMRYIIWVLLIVAQAIAGCTAAPRGRDAVGHFDTSSVKARTLDAAIHDGIGFLLKAQNRDGSFGSGAVSHGNEVTANVPASHQAFRVTVTSLCTMALREALEHGDTRVKKAHAMAVEWLVTQGQAKREEGELLYVIWANTYATQALAQEIMSGNTDPRVRTMAQWHVDRLTRYATMYGGWNYYDFEARTQTPAMGPTSFGTAAGLIALADAREAKLDVPQPLIDRALRRLSQMRMPSGAYHYSYDLRLIPAIIPAHMVPGSLGRTQVSNLALLTWKAPTMNEKLAAKGIEPFFREHGAMEAGRKRPYPHESWYQVSGYYYYFGQYYAACLLHRMPGEESRTMRTKLAAEHILPHQEADGSFWDYAMWGYHKPYGTAYAILALYRCRG